MAKEGIHPNYREILFVDMSAGALALTALLFGALLRWTMRRSLR